jgi:hypothetical protein
MAIYKYIYSWHIENFGHGCVRKLWGLLIQDNLFVDLSIACDGGLNLVGKTNQPQQMPNFGSVQRVTIQWLQ